MKTKAFTLIELLVVISVIAIIASLALSAILKITGHAGYDNSVTDSDSSRDISQKTVAATITKTFVQDNSYYVGTDKGVFFIPSSIGDNTVATKLFAEILPGQIYSLTYGNDRGIPAIISAKLLGTNKLKLEDDK